MNKFICSKCNGTQYSADKTEDKPCVYCAENAVKIVKDWNASKGAKEK